MANQYRVRISATVFGPSLKLIRDSVGCGGANASCKCTSTQDWATKTQRDEWLYLPIPDIHEDTCFGYCFVKRNWAELTTCRCCRRAAQYPTPNNNGQGCEIGVFDEAERRAREARRDVPCRVCVEIKAEARRKLPATAAASRGGSFSPFSSSSLDGGDEDGGARLSASPFSSP